MSFCCLLATSGSTVVFFVNKSSLSIYTMPWLLLKMSKMSSVIEVQKFVITLSIFLCTVSGDFSQVRMFSFVLQLYSWHGVNTQDYTQDYFQYTTQRVLAGKSRSSFNVAVYIFEAFIASFHLFCLLLFDIMKFPHFFLSKLFHIL